MLPDLQRRRLACAALILCLLLPQLTGWMPRKPILHGATARPFPAIFPLDYPLCRASSWLQAIAMAERRLPKNLDSRLRHLGVDQHLARLAVCALLFPVDVVTPEKANSGEIRVFLKEPDDLNADLEEIGNNSWQLLLEMCLVWETANAVQYLRQHWPKSTESGRQAMQELDKYAEVLRQLWFAQDLNSLTTSHPDWNETLGDVVDSAGILLACALEAPASSLARVERAVGLCLEREANAPNAAAAGLWNRLAVYGIHLRGVAHERLGQTGLAQADFDAALKRLAKVEIHDELAAAILDSRANLRRSLGNLQGMCEDLSTACGIGFCSDLAAARRQGLCAKTDKLP